MAKETGNRILASIIAGIVIIISSYAITRADSSNDDIDDHKAIPGHPVLIQRVQFIEGDIAEIKDSQHEIIKTLNSIDKRIK